MFSPRCEAGLQKPALTSPSRMHVEVGVTLSSKLILPGASAQSARRRLGNVAFN